MILQRLASAIRRQDWSQVVIEVLIVIVGIFLGLQVQAWYEDREARIVEQQTVRYLIENTNDIIEYLTYRSDLYERNQSQSLRLLEILESGTLELDDVADFEQAIISTGSVGAISAFGSGYSEQNLEGLVNIDLRRLLGEYIGNRVRYEEIINNNINPKIANLIPNIFSKSSIYRVTDNENIAAYNFEELINDPEYRNSYVGIMSLINVALTFTNRQIENSNMVLNALKKYQAGEPLPVVEFQ